MGYVTRSASQKWCLIQPEGEGSPSKQLVDSEATIADMAADISHHVGQQVTIMDDDGCIELHADWQARVNDLRDGDFL